MIKKLESDLQKLVNKKRAVQVASFFKALPGQYAEGDKFLGVPVPQLRVVAKKYQQLTLTEISTLLKSSWHEYRFVGLVLLKHFYKVAPDLKAKKKYFKFYLRYLGRVNHWDLVDLSAADIVGNYLRTIERDPSLLWSLAKSPSVWRRRVAVLATFDYIKHDDFDLTLRLARILLFDQSDLIAKSLGWMLREIGKRDQAVLEDFLQAKALFMPRIMLRYSLEKFPIVKRKRYLKKFQYQAPQVLFVCKGNVSRSQMAEGFYNSLTKTRLAFSAGTLAYTAKQFAHPAAPIQQLMLELGIDVSGQTVDHLTPSMVKQAREVHVFCKPKYCPDFLLKSAKAQFNYFPDPYGKDLVGQAETRDQVKQYVEKIVATKSLV